MRNLSVIDHVTLDGVMQSPAAREEDTRDGFHDGGWTLPYQDDVMRDYMGARMSQGPGAMLFGRRTYEHMASFWPHQPPNPITDFLNAAQKYVLSRTLSAPLAWENSTLLREASAVAELKAQDGPNLAVLGSGELVAELLRADLVDELLLTIHPLVLGAGRRLFHDGISAKLTLVDTTTTTTGVIIALYRSAR